MNEERIPLEQQDWVRLPEGLGYFWYVNEAAEIKPRPCEIRDSEDIAGKSYRELTFLRGGSWELYGFIESNPSGEFFRIIPPNGKLVFEACSKLKETK